MIDSAHLIVQYVEDMPIEHYIVNAKTRDAVERRFIIIGEALSRLRHHFPERAEQIEEQTAIRGFRNMLVHQYDEINHTLVYEIIQNHLPLLSKQLEDMIEHM